MTWEQHCSTYQPGRYSNHVTDWDAIQHDADTLETILTRALARMDITTGITPTQLLMRNEAA